MWQYFVVSVVVMIGVGLCCYAVGRSEVRRTVPGQIQKALSDAMTMQAESTAALSNALAQWDLWEKKALSYQNCIEGILNEKETWIKLYNEQVIAHGNAQTCMMDAIGFLQIKLERATGKQVTLPPIIDEARQAYLDNHVNPTLERTGTLPIHKSPPTQESPPSASSAKEFLPRK